MMTLAFKDKGDMIFLIGKSSNDIACSQYIYSYHGIRESPAPEFDLDFEYRVQSAVKGLIQKNLVRSAHDVSDGGLYINLVESSLPRNLGFDITSPAEVRKDAFLFGESQSRIVVSVTNSRETDFIDFMMETGLPFSAVGHVTKGELRIDDQSFGFISDVKKSYQTAIQNMLSE
jgi:phosphoribosylformylglycinamidine synthase